MPGTMWSTFKFVILFNPQTFYKAGISINPSLQIKKLKLTETLLKVTQLPSGKAKEQTPDRIPEPKLLNTAPSMWQFLWDCFYRLIIFMGWKFDNWELCQAQSNCSIFIK